MWYPPRIEKHIRHPRVGRGVPDSMTDSPTGSTTDDHDTIDIYPAANGEYIAEGGGIRVRAVTKKRALERLALLWPHDEAGRLD